MTTPPRLVDPTELRDALDTTGFRERRMKLRKLAQAVLENIFKTDEVIRLLDGSPIVGKGEKQIVVRPQISGLRDQFDLATLTSLAYAGAGYPVIITDRGFNTELPSLKSAIWKAIAEPHENAEPSRSSRTGYVFGRHKLMTEVLWAEMVKRVHTSAPPTAEAEPTAGLSLMRLPDDTTLDHLTRMIESVAVNADVSREKACEALIYMMLLPSDAERFEGALELLTMRGPFHTSSVLMRSLPVLHGEIVRQAVLRCKDALIEAADVLLPRDEAMSPEDFILSLDEPTPTTTPTTPHKETTTMTDTLASMPKVDPTVASMIDAMMSSAKLPPLTQIIARVGEAHVQIETQGKRIKALMDERADLERKLAEASTIPTTAEASHDGVIPSGKVEWVPASDAFGLTKGKDAFSFKVPVWTWDGAHPHVPQVDKHYVFRPFELMRVLYGIVANKRVYLHGHTGTGKTTLIEQVAARLGYPFMRLNFDSEISRMDLIGRDTLMSEGGTTVSRFVDGILPQMMQSPCLGCFDEIDFVRPDIAYVMQRMLEGDSLVITEDGGRVVKPHPMFRAFATGNTVGQGDEHGMYQGARVQSTALLDRFSVWQRIDYLKPEDRDALIRNRVPSLADGLREKLNRYIGEHLQAFTTSKVLQPLSPRGFLGLAEAMVFFTGVLPNPKDAVSQALESTILDRASIQDRVVLKGLADRVFG